MASKKKLAQKQIQRRMQIHSRVRRVIAPFVFMILLVFILSQTSDSIVSTGHDRLSMAELLAIEMKGIMVDKRIPVDIRQKIFQILILNKNHEIDLRVQEEDGSNPESIFAAITFEEKPAIVAYGKILGRFRSEQSPDLFRTTVMCGIYHEFVHLDRWPESRRPTTEEQLIEEARAYAKTSIEILRPLHRAGFPVLKDFYKLDAVLQKCGDDVNCDLFKQAIGLYIHKGIILSR
jgi:hypothetical protein